MSKIGRKPIVIGKTEVEVKGQEIRYKGPKNSGVYILPAGLKAHLDKDRLVIQADMNQENAPKNKRELNRIWGLHRALVANAISGAGQDFEKKIEINGLGFKAALAGNKLVFSLGYTHKIDFEMPKGVTVDIDKTGQKLTFKSVDKALVGHICSKVRALRVPEPYKGTGVKLATEEIIRKAGKTKA
jgi:large subunit ribosomal protein L6